MLEEDVITYSASNFSSPIVLVTKKDGSWRFCIDYRQLNKINIKDNYLLLRINDGIEWLTDANFFSKVNLKCGYWQIPILPKDSNKTAFISHNGLFESKKMPFGLSNAPATFQSILIKILNAFNNIFTIVY